MANITLSYRSVNNSTRFNSTVSTCQEQFFREKILQTSENFDTNQGYYDGLTSLNYQLLISMLICWSLLYISLKNSTKSAGKMAYLTSILPYVCLIALLLTVSQQNGFTYGISRYQGCRGPVDRWPDVRSSNLFIFCKWLESKGLNQILESKVEVASR